MHSDEVRKTFEEFFKGHDHLHLPSFPLVPKDDPTLLLINAGMAPFKVYFEGKVAPPHTRITTIQKCFRAVDIDEVGRTPRHNTFFEMLGNFSFGDYFKVEIIPWSWDYLTNWVKIPAEKMSVSVHDKDDEAYDIWHKDVGLPESKIYRLGDEHNFWMMAETGPCGPDSEIFYDLGEEFGCDSPNCGPGCDCERWPEIWNLVFTQFNREADGARIPLPKVNVDTGLGMERLCMVLQGVTSVFETDLFSELLEFAQSVTPSDVKKDKSYIIEGINSHFVFCDHIRAAVFLLADGVYPSNEGRGYVLRRIIRRCLIHLGKFAEMSTSLAKAIEPIIDKFGDIYTNLVEKREFISELLTIEQENFRKLIKSKYELLRFHIEDTTGDVFPADEVFWFYDTHGLPIDFIRDTAHSSGKTINEEGFLKFLDEQKSRSRAATASHKDDDKFMQDGLQLPEGIKATDVVYYDADTTEAEILHADDLAGIIILARTPFYPEGGGQVGDSGELKVEEITIKITDTQMLEGGVVLHQVAEQSKPLLPGLTGKKAVTSVDKSRRRGIRRAHTATHLLHAALRKVLGEHVLQSGSKVDDDEFRFDFTHFRPMTGEEMDQVRALVHEWSLAAMPVNVHSTTLKDAREKKAMALFEGKYDEEVRMIEIGEAESIISRELCGGLHARNTSEVGLFLITAETGVAAGVRRITAVTGLKAYNQFAEMSNMISDACIPFECDPPNLVEAILKLDADRDTIAKELKKLKRELQKDVADEFISLGDYINDISVITAEVDDASLEELRELGDRIKKKSGERTAILLTNSSEGKVNLIIMLSDDVVKMGFKAGVLMKEVATVVGGKGGGKPATAQGGGDLPDKVPDAFDAFKTAFSKGLC